jgi:hypothetical protein
MLVSERSVCAALKVLSEWYLIEQLLQGKGHEAPQNATLQQGDSWQNTTS